MNDETIATTDIEVNVNVRKYKLYAMHFNVRNIIVRMYDMMLLSMLLSNFTLPLSMPNIAPYSPPYFSVLYTQFLFNCLKPTMETPDQCMK